MKKKKTTTTTTMKEGNVYRRKDKRSHLGDDDDRYDGRLKEPQQLHRSERTHKKSQTSVEADGERERRYSTSARFSVLPYLSFRMISNQIKNRGRKIVLIK